MPRTSAVLDIHEAVIQGYLLGNGEVKEEIDRIVRNGKVYAAKHVGKRTGRLATGMKHVNLRVDGPLTGQARLYNNMRHARWVNNGTESPIFPKNGNYLAVPHRALSYQGVKGSELRQEHRDGGPKQYSLRASVSGQKPQRYLEKGLRDSLRANGYV